MFDIKSQALKTGAVLVLSAAMLAQPAFADEEDTEHHKTPGLVHSGAIDIEGLKYALAVMQSEQQDIIADQPEYYKKIGEVLEQIESA